MSDVRMNAQLLPRPRIEPFKDTRNLTCPHGRFWASCQRCATPRLRRDAAERNVDLCGESRDQRLAGGYP